MNSGDTILNGILLILGTPNSEFWGILGTPILPILGSRILEFQNSRIQNSRIEFPAEFTEFTEFTKLSMVSPEFRCPQNSQNYPRITELAEFRIRIQNSQNSAA